MEKYYYKEYNVGIPPTPECYFKKCKFDSDQCKQCSEFVNSDNENEWIECLLYSKNIDICTILEPTEKEIKKIDIFLPLLIKYDELNKIFNG